MEEQRNPFVDAVVSYVTKNHESLKTLNFYVPSTDLLQFLYEHYRVENFEELFENVILDDYIKIINITPDRAANTILQDLNIESVEEIPTEWGTITINFISGIYFNLRFTEEVLEIKSTEQFERMGTDELALLMSNVKPFEVVIFCNSSTKHSRLCDRGNFWQKILRYHYKGIENGKEEARHVFEMMTDTHFSLEFDNEGSRTVEDSLGHQIQIVEKFERKAYLVPTDNFYAAQTSAKNAYAWQFTDLTVNGELFKRKKVWVRGYGDISTTEAHAYESKDEAIRSFVRQWDRRDFLTLFDMVEEIMLEGREYDPEDVEEIMNTYFNVYGHQIEEGAEKLEVYFTPQIVMDKLFDMGYPQFVDGETLEEARQRLYDYIDENGFFYWGVDFRADDTAEKSKGIQIFEVELVKTTPDWYKQ
jgi:hypothetical protein